MDIITSLRSFINIAHDFTNWLIHAWKFHPSLPVWLILIFIPVYTK